jgi:hypothetical protein
MRYCLPVNFRLPLGLALLLAFGCGQGIRLAPVSGRVTMDGKPLADANIVFDPKNVEPGKDILLTFSGKADDDGHYKLFDKDGHEGAAEGVYTVSISQREDFAKMATPHRPRELVPAKYNRNTTLEFTVPPAGTDKADFELKSK